MPCWLQCSVARNFPKTGVNKHSNRWHSGLAAWLLSDGCCDYPRPALTAANHLSDLRRGCRVSHRRPQNHMRCNPPMSDFTTRRWLRSFPNTSWHDHGSRRTGFERCLEMRRRVGSLMRPMFQTHHHICTTGAPHPVAGSPALRGGYLPYTRPCFGGQRLAGCPPSIQMVMLFSSEAHNLFRAQGRLDILHRGTSYARPAG